MTIKTISRTKEVVAVMILLTTKAFIMGMTRGKNILIPKLEPTLNSKTCAEGWIVFNKKGNLHFKMNSTQLFQITTQINRRLFNVRRRNFLRVWVSQNQLKFNNKRNRLMIRSQMLNKWHQFSNKLHSFNNSSNSNNS